MTKQITLKGAIRETYNGKRMFALLTLLVKEKVVDLTKASKVFSGNHSLTLKSVRKLKSIYGLDIEIYIRRKGTPLMFFILR